MMTCRPGHSLPELIVTVTFLGAAFGGIAASSLLGTQWAGKGVARQDAVRRASALLDSVTDGGLVGAGRLDETRWTVDWESGPGGRVTVRVVAPDSTDLARLTGRKPPFLPVLHDSIDAGGQP